MAPEGEMYERLALLERYEKIDKMRETIAFLEKQDRIAELKAKHHAEMVEIKAQLLIAENDLKDKEIALACVKAMLKTYMDFVEALNPNAKAFEKAMQKLNKP